MMRNFAYVRPTSLDDATTRLAKPGARACAGGTDLLGCLRDEVFEADTIVSLGALARAGQGIAQGISSAGAGLSIGALTTLAELARDERIRTSYTALSEGAGAAASPQLRNQGTLGGNLCQRPRCWFYRGEYPCARKGGDTCFAIHGDNRYHCIFGGGPCFIVHPSDTAPALVALGAVARIAGPGGRARSVPLEEFFVLPAQNVTRENVLEPGEVIVEVSLPAAPARSAYRKARARRSWDFALAGAAVALTMKGDKVERARVVLSGVAPVPWRAKASEAALAGSALDARAVRRAAVAAVEGADPMTDNAYKVALTRGIVEEALTALLGA
jgi:xanthine dehydrogenase YagS FAD-binding subunit